MEKAEFKNVELKANDYDKFVFEFIIHRLNFYDCYYGDFIRYLPELKYQEFSTLKDDLKVYLDDVIYVNGSIDVKQIQSFKRSCELMKGKLNKYRDHNRNDFINFLDFCIKNLDSMVDKFIDETLASLQ